MLKNLNNEKVKKDKVADFNENFAFKKVPLPVRALAVRTF